MLIARFLQGPADEADVVGGPAAAAGLADDDGDLVRVVLAGQDGLHDLAHHHQRRIAGVVVHVLQPHIHGLLVVVGQHLHVVAGGVEGGLQQLEVDGRHLRDRGWCSPRASPL